MSAILLAWNFAPDPIHRAKIRPPRHPLRRPTASEAPSRWCLPTPTKVVWCRDRVGAQEEIAMRKIVAVLALTFMGLVASTGGTVAAANNEAPCIGENASTLAPVLRPFGQVVVAPEAQAGLTGGVAS